MLPEFSARAVSREIIEHLERRRPAIVKDEAAVRAEVQAALVPIRRSYAEMELPPAYLSALEEEVVASVPARWRASALPFTAREAAGFGLWRGGDPLARLTYVLAGLVVGGLIVAAPFIPIWEKWFPFALAVAAWWLPDLQIRFARRRYARALGDIVETVARAQPALERHVMLSDLLPPGSDT